MQPYEPELSDEIKKAKKTLRSGYTTGACAAAAAKASAIAYKEGILPKQVEITLPKGQKVIFEVLPPAILAKGFGATIKKDAGDDPDCTDGALITVHLQPLNNSDHIFKAGQGVGIVTLDGLGIPIGEPSITKIPRQMIFQAIKEVTDEKFEITISVPNGEEMAKQTTNERLGIVGGISILGTTGIVKPFSTAAYRASVVQQIDLATKQNLKELAFVIGSRSDLLAQKIFSLPKLAIIEVGDFTGMALKRAVPRGVKSINFVAMVGKLTKIATGVMMTHFHKSQVNTELLKQLAIASNAPPAVVNSATETAAARHFFETCLKYNTLKPLELLCYTAKRQMLEFVSNKLEINVFLSDFEGSNVVASTISQTTT